MSLNITVIKDKILSENYFILRNITYNLTQRNGEVVQHKREVYDRGNGATVLLYNRQKQSVVLVRQFRVATWVNGNIDGMLIETCAGLLDDDEPEACIRKEAIEEINDMDKDEFFEHVVKNHPSPQAPRYIWKVQKAMDAM